MLTGATAGYLQSKKLSARTGFWEEYQKFLVELTVQIRYYSGSLQQIFKKFTGYLYLSSTLEICRKGIAEGNSFCEAWERGIQTLSKEVGLSSNDCQVLLELGKGLGISDLEGQLSLLSLNKELAGLRLEESRENKTRKGKLYQILGLSLGITAALLFV